MSLDHFAKLVLAAVLLLELLSPLAAATLYFSDRTGFQVAAPLLPLEDFEEGAVGGFFGPLSASTAVGGFAVGEIASGVTFTATPAGFNGDLAILGPLSGLPSLSLGHNVTGGTLSLTFQNANAVGFDLLGPFRTAPAFVAGNMRVVFASGPDEIVPFSVDRFGEFVGIIAMGTTIIRIDLTPTGNTESAFVDNVEFGMSQVVPEPGTLTLLGSAGVLLMLIRRRLRTSARNRV